MSQEPKAKSQEPLTKIGNSHIVHTEAGAMIISDSSISPYSDSYAEAFLSKKVDWEMDPVVVMGKQVVPYGANNNLPSMIRDIMDDNNLAPGILEREIGLLYGDGPALYELKIGNQNEPTANREQPTSSKGITREYISDSEIEAWLADWNYKRFIDMAMVEFKYLKGVFAKRYLNRGGRIGRPKFVRNLEVIPGTDARLAWPKTGPKRLESVKKIYTGDFENNCYDTGITPYPVYDPWDPFSHPVSIGYHNRYSFGRSFYPVPSYFGTLNWIERSSDIPKVLKYLGENGITSAFHIQSPAGYWQSKQELYEKQYPEKTDAQVSTYMDELQTATYQKMAKTLTGKKNAGKFITSVSFYDEDGNHCEWKVDPIDQKIGDFIEAQIKISEKADSATTSGLGLHPSLSNIIVNGQLSSGSQMLYALKLYMASDTTIPEEVIFEPINQAIAANFPKKKVRMGFYHHTVMKEQEVSPQNRTKENTEK
ncbi:MAG: hypothetical protein ABJG41_01365 [Cyclobacteriaceae bacterium]